MNLRFLLFPCLAIAACSAEPEPVPGVTQPSPPAQAQPEQSPDSEQMRASAMQTCASFAKLANQIMAARQNGMPMRELMDTVASDEIADITRRMIVQAYEAPGYSTETHQRREIVDFENAVYAECLRANDLP